MTPTPLLPAALDRRAIAAWCVYDWANSAFPAVITTFVFATYFTQAVAPDPVTGTTMWGHALAGAGFVIAVLSPVLGSIADYTGRQKLWLAIFTALTAAAIAALWFVKPSPGIFPPPTSRPASGRRSCLRRMPAITDTRCPRPAARV